MRAVRRWARRHIAASRLTPSQFVGVARWYERRGEGHAILAVGRVALWVALPKRWTPPEPPRREVRKRINVVHRPEES